MTPQLTGTPLGLTALAVFVGAYAFVVLEERLALRKSKPVMLAAALIWALIAWHAARTPSSAPDSPPRPSGTCSWNSPSCSSS
jgi:hypothetical protein